MQTSAINRLKEVSTFFDNNDKHLGYRRLLDAALETRSMSIYESTLAFCDWYDSNNQAQDDSLLLSRVHDLLARIQQATPSPTPASTIPLLKGDNISKKYNKGAFALAPVNLALHPGEIIGLVGENGNGKTTLLRLLYGELLPDKGKLEFHLSFNHTAIKKAYDIKSALAFIPQRPNKWYGSLMDNLQFASAHYGYKGKDNYLWTEMICARMGLRPFRKLNWGQISSGYKMRFELAKALLKSPQVMLLDEPLANLDIFAQQIILEDLRFLAQSQSMPMGIILSSQQLYEVEKVSHQVIFLKQGVPKYQLLQQSSTEPANEVPNLVIEMETTASREQLNSIFAILAIQQISFNGGAYIISFPPATSPHSVIRLIGESELPVKYFRDISNSSRRFFEA